MTIVLNPGKVTLSQLEAVYWNGEVSKLHHDTHFAIKKGAERIAKIAAEVSQFTVSIPVLVNWRRLKSMQTMWLFYKEILFYHIVVV